MCIDKTDKTKTKTKSPTAPHTYQINKPKKEKQIKQVLNTPRTRPTSYKIIKPSLHDTSTTSTATTKRVVESITVCI